MATEKGETREVLICGVPTTIPEWYYQWISYTSALPFDEFQADWHLYEGHQEESPVFSAFWKKKYEERMAVQ